MMENSPPKSGTGAWKSIDDAFESWLSVAQIKPVNRSGKKKSAAEIYGYRTQPSTSQNQNVDEDETKSEEEETVQETPVYGLGRGRFLKQQEQKCPIEQLDETIHNELKALFGSGNSNEAIERHFATACSSSSEASAHDTRAFFKPPPYSEEHKNEDIEIVFGESNIMKKIRAQEALSSCTQNLESSKKRSPKCRNALVLSLTQKKTSNETEQHTKQVPELKGPDLFLSNKSYSNVTSAASSSSCNQADEPVFNEENFPAL